MMADEGGTWSAGAITSTRPSSRDIEVFLNFEGSDSRCTVVDFICNALVSITGVRVFYVDGRSIKQGEVIEGEMMEAITNSKIYIPIFSKNYAYSKWCLRELEKIMECWEASQKQKEKKTILPIFYDVDVSTDINLKSKVYTTALQKHKNELGEDVVKPWEIALQKATKINGWSINSHGLAKLTRLIVEEVCCMLPTRSDAKKVHLFVEKYALGGTLEKLKKEVHKNEVEETTNRTPLSKDLDVFLNFRGPDSRFTVANVLYDVMNRVGIRVFYDDGSKGEVTEGELKEAIINSKIYILIFSKDYAASGWCLYEIGKIMECWEASQEQEEKKTVLPIFYDVNFLDVGLKTEVYTNALQKHKDVLGEDVVKPWEIALLKAAEIKGWDIQNHGLHGLAKLIVEEVRFNLWTVSDPEKVIDDQGEKVFT